MLHDRARVHVEAGAGGNGVISFRREAHVPRGGPDGGDGGRGGDVVLVADPSRRDLASLRYSPHLRAGRGRHGQGKQRHGARGEDRVVPVPPGTVVEGLEGARFDLVEPGQRAVVARGGAGGRGNKRFATSTRQAPRFAERGLTGEAGWIELRLKLLTDAGLIGLPNAGKSSLLRRLTRAAPKVADYPFTTLEPVLGTIDDGERQLVLADIPGLIEGAAEGAGLGHEFLAHIERCRALVHLVSLEAELEGGAVAGLDGAGDGSAVAVDASGDPLSAPYETVRAELAAHGAGLEELPEIVVLSKRDLIADERAAEPTARWRERLGERALAVAAISTVTGAGIDELRRAIFAAVPAEHPPAEVGAAEVGAEPGPRFEVEYELYTPGGDQGYEITPEGEGAFRVHGRGVELLFARHDLSNPEALAYLEQRLREIGVIAALERQGFQPGDEIRIGDHELELDPG